MACPRIFVSSTFYDLKQLRADIDRFIRSLGYEAILNERGLIPYGKDDALEEYCYREIATVDMVLAIVGGRFGATSTHAPYSISQQEIKTALDNNKPVFIFVQRDVLAEFETFRKNKDNETVQFASVTDRKVFLFIEELYALPNNNPIAPFDRAEDITDYLKEQWAGLFQRSLAEQGKRHEANLIARLTSTTDTLNQLVQLLAEEKRGSDTAVKEILLTTHPIFSQLRQLTNNRYRIFFSNRMEMEEWLKAKQYTELESILWDRPDYFEWAATSFRQGKRKNVYLHIYEDVFEEDGRLKVFTPSEWKTEWVYTSEVESPIENKDIKDEDIPF